MYSWMNKWVFSAGLKLDSELEFRSDVGRLFHARTRDSDCTVAELWCRSRSDEVTTFSRSGTTSCVIRTDVLTELREVGWSHTVQRLVHQKTQFELNPLRCKEDARRKTANPDSPERMSVKPARVCECIKENLGFWTWSWFGLVVLINVAALH